ncbi:MAG: hypothetical protein Q9195_007035 [Heterodermia aff. obscurata]
MSRPSALQVNLPDVKRKPLSPGPNSWAQDAQKANVMKGNISGGATKGVATNRSKYEDKPMPPLPPTPDRDGSTPGPGKPGYIQPATPLTYSSLNPAKGRAVTDPVSSKTLFGAGKGSITDLRNKFSGSRTNTSSENVTNEHDKSSNSEGPTSSPPEVQTQRTSDRNVNQIRRETPPSSAPVNTSLPDPYRSSEIVGRQTNSTPVPTRRYLRENGLATPILTQVSFSVPQLTYNDVDQAREENNRPDGIIIGNGRLNPTRSGTYGTVGEVEFVEGKAVHRVASCMGMIEEAESSPSVVGQQQGPGSTNTSPTNRRFVDDHTMLQSVAYSPSVYAGIWENDPQVGQTLPPFSPMAPRLHDNLEQTRKTDETLGLQDGSFHGGASRFQDIPSPAPFNNSWTPTHNQSHFHASVPPLFSSPVNNAVPPPPPTYHEYQPTSRPLPPELSMLELNIHHHIDTCFGSMSRLITDKIDQCSDQLLRRIEDGEHRLERLLKGIKADIKSIQNDTHAVQDSLGGIQERNDCTLGSIQNLHINIDNISSKFEKYGDDLAKLQSALAALSTAPGDHEKALSGVERGLRELGEKIDRRVESKVSDNPTNGTSPRRSQSTSQPSSASYGQRQHLPSGTGNPSVGPRNSNASSRGRRSNTSAGGATSTASDGRNTRREFFAEIGSSLGAAPDLRQHPAFLSAQQNHAYDPNGHPLGVASDGSMYQLSSFTGGGPNGWYQQAYGS